MIEFLKAMCVVMAGKLFIYPIGMLAISFVLRIDMLRYLNFEACENFGELWENGRV